MSKAKKYKDWSLNFKEVWCPIYAFCIKDGYNVTYAVTPSILVDKDLQKKFVTECGVKVLGYSARPDVGVFSPVRVPIIDVDEAKKQDWYWNGNYNDPVKRDYDNYKLAEKFITRLRGALLYQGIDENIPESVIKFINKCYDNGLELFVNLNQRGK